MTSHYLCYSMLLRTKSQVLPRLREGIFEGQEYKEVGIMRATTSIFLLQYHKLE